jgi:hypothetical protein
MNFFNSVSEEAAALFPEKDRADFIKWRTCWGDPYIEQGKKLLTEAADCVVTELYRDLTVGIKCNLGHSMTLIRKRPAEYKECIGFTCDICHVKTMTFKDPFYHCMTCRNYDMCMKCRQNRIAADDSKALILDEKILEGKLQSSRLHIQVIQFSGRLDRMITAVLISNIPETDKVRIIDLGGKFYEEVFVLDGNRLDDVMKCIT